MFNFSKPEQKPTVLDDAIENLTQELAGADAGSEEEGRISESLKKVVEAKAALLNADQPDFVRAEVWVTVAASFATAVLTLKHEQLNVITSKVFPPVLQRLINIKV